MLIDIKNTVKKNLELTGINDDIYVDFLKLQLLFFIVNFQKLVVKPDQLIKRRGKLGLIKVNVNLQEAKKWIDERTGKDIQVSLCYAVQYLLLLMMAFFLVVTPSPPPPEGSPSSSFFSQIIPCHVKRYRESLKNRVLSPCTTHLPTTVALGSIETKVERQDILFENPKFFNC